MKIETRENKIRKEQRGEINTVNKKHKEILTHYILNNSKFKNLKLQENFLSNEQ